MPTFTITEVSDNVRAYDTDCLCGCGGRPKEAGRKWVSGHHRRVPFADNVAKSDGCWEWIGYKRAGYGRIKINGRHYSAHRIAWQTEYGPIPDGLKVCHRCDNPGCVRPDHLFLGTQADNVVDRDTKGRGAPARRGALNGRAKLTPEQVVAIRLRRAEGLTYRAIAEPLGVSISTVQLVATGKRWAP